MHVGNNPDYRLKATYRWPVAWVDQAACGCDSINPAILFGGDAAEHDQGPHHYNLSLEVRMACSVTEACVDHVLRYSESKAG